jgi:hypothetical protein
MARAPAAPAIIHAGYGICTVGTNRSITHAAAATRARRNTSFATSVADQPLAVKPSTEYQLKKTLISRTMEPPSEIITERGILARSTAGALAGGGLDW